MIDERIDRALSTYVSPEIPAGLEESILARVREPRRRLRAKWMLAAAAACALVMVIREPRTKTGDPTVAIEQHRGDAGELSYPNTAQAKAPASHSFATIAQAKPAAPQRRRLRKQRIFPKAEPVPAAEVELGRLLAEKPEIAQAFTAQAAPLEPIIIEPVSIKAIDED